MGYLAYLSLNYASQLASVSVEGVAYSAGLRGIGGIFSGLKIPYKMPPVLAWAQAVPDTVAHRLLIKLVVQYIERRGQLLIR